MLVSSHALIGASIAKLIPNPYLSLPINIIFHFLADIFPHWDLKTRTAQYSKFKLILYSSIDLSIGFLLAYLLFPEIQKPYLFISIVAAQLPDWIEAPYHVFDWNFPPFSTIKKIQSKLHNKLDLPWGLILQILVVLLFIFIAKIN